MINSTAEGAGYTIVENGSLEGRNTFHVAARADMLIDVRKRDALTELGVGETPAGVASAVEFVLEGLHLSKRLNKDSIGGKTTYRSRG